MYIIKPDQNLTSKYPVVSSHLCEPETFPVVELSYTIKKYFQPHLLSRPPLEHFFFVYPWTVNQ